MDLGLNGKRVLITGGSKGIGASLGEAFAAEGANVILVSRTADVLKKTLQLLAKEESNPVEIGTAFAERLPPVRADAEQLFQVFLNLSLNALQAMPQGGKLLISTGLRRATRRGAAAAFLEIRFRDTGVGIPPEKLESVFAPFVQVRVERASRVEGTGLGLAISRDLARGMGGDLTAESTVGAGSTFTLVLPVTARGA